MTPSRTARRSFFLLALPPTLLLADACRLPAPAVPTAEDMLIRAPIEGVWNGAGGFEIVAGWDKPFPSYYFDATPNSVSWAEGNDLLVGRDFSSGVGLGVTSPPHRWQSDGDGITWTKAGELWNASPGRPPRLLWRYGGAAESFVLGQTCIFVTLAPGGDGVATTSADSAPREVWRIAKTTGEAVRVATVTGHVTSMVADDDELFFTDRDGHLRHVEGITERVREVSRKLGGLVGVDGRYIYGSDRSYIYRAPKAGGAATAIAHFGDWGGLHLGSGRYTVLDQDVLFWVEGSGLYAAPAAGGEKRLLADLLGTVDQLVPAGNAIYVRESAGDSVRVLRVPKRGTPAAQKTVTEYENVFNFAAHGPQLYWVVADKLWGAGVDGKAAVLATLGHSVDSLLVADDTHVYFATEGEEVWRVAAGGGAPEKVADWDEIAPQPGANSFTFCCAPDTTIALDAQNVYFTSRTRGAVARIAKGVVGSYGAQILARGLARPRALHLDDASLYVLSDGEVSTSCRAQLAVLSKEGGAPKVLSSDLTCGGKMALTTTTVWLAETDGHLKRIPKQGGKALVFPQPASFDVVAIAGTGDTLFFSAASRIFTIKETASTPSVVASGLLNPATSMLIEGQTLLFIDEHSSKGIPGSRLHRLPIGTGTN